MNKKKARKTKKSKARRVMRQTTYDPSVESEYSQKKMLQAKGIYSGKSPLHIVETPKP